MSDRKIRLRPSCRRAYAPRPPAGAIQVASTYQRRKEGPKNMTKYELVAPPIGTIYRLSHMRHYTRLREDEYWQVERRTEKTVWLRQLVTNTAGEPMLGMIRIENRAADDQPLNLDRRPHHAPHRQHGQHPPQCEHPPPPNQGHRAQARIGTSHGQTQTPHAG